MSEDLAGQSYLIKGIKKVTKIYDSAIHLSCVNSNVCLTFKTISFKRSFKLFSRKI